MVILLNVNVMEKREMKEERYFSYIITNYSTLILGFLKNEKIWSRLLFLEKLLGVTRFFLCHYIRYYINGPLFIYFRNCIYIYFRRAKFIVKLFVCLIVTSFDIFSFHIQNVSRTDLGKFCINYFEYYGSYKRSNH